MSQLRSRSSIRRNRSRAVTEGVQNVGTFLSNLVSRVASQFTRRNRDHLVVPINESFRSSKSNSPRRSKSNSPRSSKSSSSRKKKANSVDLNDIDTALGFKSTFKKSGAKSRKTQK
jgi:flagellar basal body L-ring protein FlgH